jgi:hypothetical protein
MFQQYQIPALQYSTKDIKEIETRVLKVIGEYDKISAAKVNIKDFGNFQNNVLGSFCASY